MAPVIPAAKVKKWENGIDPTDTEDNIKEYVDTKLHVYESQGYVDYNLWAAFRRDFKCFNDITTMGKIKWTDQMTLKTYLRCGGVWVAPGGRHVNRAGSLVDVLMEETMHEWSDDDILNPGEIRSDLANGNIRSPFLTLNGYYRRNPPSVQTPFQAQNAPPPQVTPVPLPQTAPRAPVMESTVDITKAPVDLPFASFRQEPIPLYLQAKELPEERQQRLDQQHQKRARNLPEERRLRLRQQETRPQNRPKPQRTTKTYAPQPSSCRLCQENFNSRNALFRHLTLCKTSRSQASSISRSRASSTSSTTSSRACSVSSKSSASRVSRASSTALKSSVSSTSSIASIEKAQLRILSQLYALRSQNLLFFTTQFRNALPGPPQIKTSRPPVKTTLFTDHTKTDSYAIDSCLTPESIVNAPRARSAKSTADVPKGAKTFSKINSRRHQSSSSRTDFKTSRSVKATPLRITSKPAVT